MGLAGWLVAHAFGPGLQILGRYHMDLFAYNSPSTTIDLGDTALAATQRSSVDHIRIDHNSSSVIVELQKSERPVVTGMMSLHSIDNRNHRGRLRNAQNRFRITVGTQSQHAHAVVATFVKDTVDPSHLTDYTRINNLRQKP